MGLVVDEGEGIEFAHPHLLPFFAALYWHQRPHNENRLHTLLAWAGSIRFLPFWRFLASMEAGLAESLTGILQSSPSRHARCAAAFLLGRLEYQPALPALKASLRDPEWMVQRAGALALARMGDRKGLAFVRRQMWSYAKGEHPFSDDDLVEMGAAGVPLLIQGLRARNYYARYASASALGRLRHPGAFGPLVKELHDARKGAHLAIGTALAEYGERGVEALFDALRSSNEDTRSMAIYGLGVSGAERAAEPLQELFLSAGEESDEAAQALRILGPRGVPALIEGLTHPDPEVRGNAAYGLGSSRSPLAVDALLEALSDPDERVRDWAITSLHGLSDPRAVAPLIDRLTHDASSLARGTAAAALGRIRDVRAVEPLIQVLQIDPDDFVRLRAAEALTQFRAQSAIDALAECVDRNPTHWEAVAEIRALGMIGGPRAVAFLSEKVIELGERSSTAVYGLAIMGSAGEKALLELLHHPEAGVRREVVGGVRYLAPAGAFRIIQRAVVDREREVRCMAVHWLGHAPRDKRVGPLLIQSLQDADADVRRAAVSALIWSP